jgi:hypothetical protein
MSRDNFHSARDSQYDDGHKRGGDNPYVPPAHNSSFDIGADLIKEAQEGAADGIRGIAEALLIATSDLAHTAKNAAKQVSAPCILLTRATWSQSPDEPPPRTPIVFGAEYPNGTVCASNGGFTLVLTPAGLMVFGRRLGSETDFNPIKQNPSDLRPYAKLMAIAGITPGMIVDELTAIAKKGGVPAQVMEVTHELGADSIGPELCCKRFAKGPTVLPETRAVEPEAISSGVVRDSKTSQTAPGASLLPPRERLDDKGDRVRQVSESLETKTPASSSPRATLGALVVGLGGIPLVLKSSISGNAGALEISIFAAALVAGWFISRSSSRR